MKKIAIFFIVIIVIIVSIFYAYINYQKKSDEIHKYNFLFENCYNKEIYGAEVATIINKAMDNNYKNKIEKDSSGNYIENDENSIKIDIKMIDNDTTYNMETIFNGGISTFTTYYTQIKFKCTKIEYHKKTQLVKYMLFEQITQ